MFLEIEKLPPAHILIFERDSLQIRRYWSLSFVEKSVSEEDEALQKLEEKLGETINSHLVADVPVGAFLSGGMDSSMIVAMAARDLGARLMTFSVGVKESDFNELPYARMVAEHAGTSHREACVNPQLLELLPRIIWHLDEPTDPIAACQFVASQFASESVKVVLGGDGGDELFAGFDRYRWLPSVGTYRKIPSSVRRHVFDNLIDFLPDSFTYKSLSQKMRWVQHLSRTSDLAERYAEATTFFRFCHESKRQLFTESWWRQVKDGRSTEVIAQPFSSDHAEDFIDRMLYADFVTRLPEHSLMLADKMAMAQGLEVRSPYLDHELVELLASFPAHLKLRGGTLKYLLRELSKRYLPKEICRRQKQGFMFPIAYWFREDAFVFLQECLLHSWFVSEGIFSRNEVVRLLEEHRKGKVDHHVRLWMLLSLEVWHRLFVTQVPVDALEEEFRVRLAHSENRVAV
jgi:asparagine synthase (glutamine-hydrolysing)